MKYNGDIIKEVRKEKGLSQYELGKLIGLPDGRAQTTIQKYESGGLKLTKDIINLIAGALKFPVWTFMDGANDIGRHIPVYRSDQIHLPALLRYSIETPLHFLTDDPDTFALRLDDDSMEPEFSVGDYIIVSPRTSPESGSFVVVACDGKYRLKQLIIYLDHFVLRSFKMPGEQIFPIDKHENLNIIGKVIGKIKKY